MSLTSSIDIWDECPRTGVWTHSRCPTNPLPCRASPAMKRWVHVSCIVFPQSAHVWGWVRMKLTDVVRAVTFMAPLALIQSLDTWLHYSTCISHTQTTAASQKWSNQILTSQTGSTGHSYTPTALYDGILQDRLPLGQPFIILLTHSSALALAPLSNSRCTIA